MGAVLRDMLQHLLAAERGLQVRFSMSLWPSRLRTAALAGFGIGEGLRVPDGADVPNVLSRSSWRQQSAGTERSFAYSPLVNRSRA